MSPLALEKIKNNPCVDETILGNILNMPVNDDYLDGIWNSGVMEHFFKDEVLLILKEFHRTLKNDGKIVLFWPSSKLPIGWLIDQIIHMGVDLPGAVWSPSRKEIKLLLKEAGFQNIIIKISYSLNHYIVIAQK